MPIKSTYVIKDKITSSSSKTDGRIRFKEHCIISIYIYIYLFFLTLLNFILILFYFIVDVIVVFCM